MMNKFTVEDLFHYRRKGAGGLVDAYEQLQQRIAELEAQLGQLHEQQDSKAITMLFGLMGYLTSMEEPITFSAYHNATPGADILSRLIQANDLKGDCDWDSYKPPKEQDDV